ncbi:hypothetical protein K440DRAFT_615370 [Wilcoxina mikolae CBS 423.85]|nr:hypothetical protein K440DRAFT_615370 [Wilcoxina mikolae CBS 423.85]
MTTATTKISDDPKTSTLKAPPMNRPLVNEGGPRKPQIVLTHKAAAANNHRRDDQPQPQPQPPPIKRSAPTVDGASQKLNLTSKPYKEPVRFQKLRLTHKAALAVKSATTETVGGGIKSATMSKDAQQQPQGKRSGDEQLATDGRPQKRQKVGNMTRLDTKPKVGAMRRVVEIARERDAGKIEPGINRAQFRNITSAIPTITSTIPTIPPTILPTNTPLTLPTITPIIPAISIPLQAEETPLPDVRLSGCGDVPLTSFQRVYAQRCKEHFPPGVRGIMGLGFSWMLQNRREDNERAAIKAVVVVEKGRKLQRRAV